MKQILRHLSAVLAVILVCSVLVTTLVACTPSNAASNLAIAKPVYPEAVKAPGEGATDKDFDAFAAWYLHFAEKRELLGATNHLLYICRKAQ